MDPCRATISILSRRSRSRDLDRSINMRVELTYHDQATRLTRWCFLICLHGALLPEMHQPYSTPHCLSTCTHTLVKGKYIISSTSSSTRLSNVSMMVLCPLERSSKWWRRKGKEGKEKKEK